MGNINTLFISHSHYNQKYVKELVDLVKFVGCSNIVCSSYPGHGIPQDEDIYDYLREKLSGDVWVIFVLSKDYYLSPACLNEMGATWVLQKQYTTIFLPNFEFSEVKGAVNPMQIAFKLHDKGGWNDFKENLVARLGLKRPNDNQWESIRDQKMQNINQLADEERKRDKPSRIEFENVTSVGTDTIRIGLRLINDNDYPVEFPVINLELQDENNNSLVRNLRDMDANLHHKENKILFIDVPLEGCAYDVDIHLLHSIDWRSRRRL